MLLLPFYPEINKFACSPVYPNKNKNKLYIFQRSLFNPKFFVWCVCVWGGGGGLVVMFVRSRLLLSYTD